MKQLVSDLPQIGTSDDFTSKLFTRIGQEGFAEKRTKAYLPKRVPLFGVARLATAASVAVIVLTLGISFNLGDRLLFPNSPQMATAPTVDNGTADDLYLTVLPTDNPLLNEHKSVSRMIEQYNRWREYSRALRSNSGAEHFLGGDPSITMASAQSDSRSNIIVRPVVKSYLISP
jgi:hypothetical protein